MVEKKVVGLCENNGSPITVNHIIKLWIIIYLKKSYELSKEKIYISWSYKTCEKNMWIRTWFINSIPTFLSHMTKRNLKKKKKRRIITTWLRYFLFGFSDNTLSIYFILNIEWLNLESHKKRNIRFKNLILWDMAIMRRFTIKKKLWIIKRKKYISWSYKTCEKNMWIKELDL